MAEDDYPECDKLAQARSASLAIRDFLTWAQTKGFFLAEWRETYGGELVRSNTSLDKLLAEHFGYDLHKVEVERRAMLKSLARTA